MMLHPCRCVISLLLQSFEEALLDSRQNWREYVFSSFFSSTSIFHEIMALTLRHKPNDTLIPAMVVLSTAPVLTPSLLRKDVIPKDDHAKGENVGNRK